MFDPYVLSLRVQWLIGVVDSPSESICPTSFFFAGFLGLGWGEKASGGKVRRKAKNEG
jgi:hypothetical protein